VAGTFSFVVRVNDVGIPPQAVTQAFGIVFTNPLGITNPTNLNNGSVGVPYSIAMLGSGGTPPYSWSVPTGQLPPGLTLSSAGILSGTPTSTGTFNFTVQVGDSVGALLPASFVISIQTGLTITTESVLPIAVINSPYSKQIQASITDSLTWSVVSGNLPPGTTMSAAGLISGTPTSVGVYNFTVQAVGGSPQQIAAQPFKLEVVAALAISSASTLPDATLSSVYTTTLAATGGVAPYKWTQTNGS